tara:strand:+ start:1801 stop:3201 length:1401 start_codon:yes stop_codon:yes gene_type:complete
MAYTAIDKAISFFRPYSYTGTGSSTTKTDVGFTPDMAWGKNRANNQGHWIIDSMRGNGNYIGPNTTGAQNNDVGAFGMTTGGFTFPSGDAFFNGSGNGHIAWSWLMGGTAPTKTYTVKVVSDSGNKYRFDDFGTSAVTLDLQEGGTYTFDQSDSSNSGHPFRFGTSSGNASDYTTGVTTTGTPGQSGAKTVITVAAGAPNIYYNCSVHSGMGGAVNTNSTTGSSDFGGSAQSLVNANTTTGCSIVKYSGTGSSQTIGHGLGVEPNMMWIRRLDGTEDWAVYNKSHGGAGGSGSGYYQALNTTEARSSNNNRFSAAPTSSAFTVNSHSAVNHSGGTHIAYCFANKPGFSRIGTYVGNGSSNGPTIFTGFRPSFVMYKGMVGGNAADNWEIADVARFTTSPGNPQDEVLYPNINNAEGQDVTDRLIFLANGFKMITNGSDYNGDGQTYTYMAFGQSFVAGNNIPATAF